VSEILQRVEGEIQNRRLLVRGQKILVAVSGGVDSMVLLHVLLSLAVKNRWRICIAHFNHRLRGRSSDADEYLVRKTAAEMNLPIVVERADVKLFAKKSKLSVEMAARKLRHEFLAREASKRKIKTIALAHHADDQVELFFLRLLRGAGGEGLAGMKWHAPSPAGKSISLVRPLLGCSKRELLEHARENKIRFREDATNFSTDFLRNRIRNELLPLLLGKYQPALDQAVLRLMDIVGAEAEFAGDVAQRWLHNLRGSRGDEAQNKNKLEPPYVGCYDFDDLPLAIQRRVLQSQLTELGVAPNFDLIESLRQSPNQFISVGPNASAARDESGKIMLRAETEMEFDAQELAVNLTGQGGKVLFGGIQSEWTKTSPISRGLKSAIGNWQSAIRRQESFDADKIGGKIILRHWRPGDRFQPIGLKSAAKLQDLFVNAKIPRERRRKLVLAETGRGEIFWVEGLRIGERFKLTPQTARTLVWKWSNLAV
jgi:tRNA(Ile)-lysidine synthase